ncbi:SWIM zinc finger family protein [Nocardia sp. CDC160]|uniref:SWIM zinc finger family protein n=1 Tax=Nocardia sp. CDC160 TaxID=3112166 RepID=UPI002DB9D922|nr:SWIM zinc finger family protein [Nocardia sp. CDC160]MEC3916591.1 SWIM zinc finger family protein [Nocardia sp. CDC160]
MTTAWTADHIGSLAPDAASLTAARKLRGKWSGTGIHDTALWGLCQGSGSRPYQTIVDLSGPAYKCTCPSRKFPCKHALSLLLTWSAGEVSAADSIADFAADWLGGRAAKAAKAAEKSAPEAKPSRGGGATADQRRARVGAGLSDLDTWLTDQVRTGLAQADRSPRAFETVAARMVDAQAPAIAATLRRLPLSTTHSDWPRLLLREYARLHLLATAHTRLDELPPELRASVRTHIGYPTPAESVRAEPAVRETWQVLGVRTTVEDALYTRRVWLRARGSGRWALLVDHHYGSPAFPNDTPAPGFQVDASVHYYPSATPLRAIWGERHQTPEPFTTIPLPNATHDAATAYDAAPGPLSDAAGPMSDTSAQSDNGAVVPGPSGSAATSANGVAYENGGPAAEIGVGAHTPPGSIATRPGSIAAALVEQARAVGADPFLRSWPVLLAEVVPVRGEKGWYVVESGGDALPISIAEGEPWRLLGLAGGHPVTLLGEWTVDGLVPVAALAAGNVVDVGVAQGNPVPLHGGIEDGASAELVSAALVGTARRQADVSGLAAPVADATAGLTGDAAAILLESIALQDCFARGGVTATSAERGEVAADDERPLLPAAAAARLGDLLADNSPFLDEWFALVAPRDFRAPDGLVSTLLDRAKALAPHREPLLRLAGARGRWLAAQHPGWRSLVRAAADDESVWSHGRAAERRSWLAQQRQRDPAAARAALAGSWAKESGPGKAELLAVLADGLSIEDERLLEAALDDRRAEVRRLAADLLGQLPDSAFAQRMAERAASWLSFERRLVRPQLTTTGPGVLDDAARRDGVGDSFGYTAYRADGAPDLSTEWLHRVVAGTPLRHWERLLGSAEEAVRVSMAESVRGPMLAGWTDAALAQRDSAWAAALFGVLSDARSRDADGEKLRELFALQPEADQIRHLRGLDSSWLAEIESLLRAMPHPWPEPLAEHVLRLLLERAQLAADRPGAPSLVPGSYRTLFRAASAHFPVQVAERVTAAARWCADPYWEQAFDQLAHDLIERKTMLEELQ